MDLRQDEKAREIALRAWKLPECLHVPIAAVSEAAIVTYGFSQHYLQLGEPQADGSSVVRMWFKPYVTLIWLGCVVMAAAGALSLTYRRLRVGAPQPAPARAAAE